MDSNNSQAVFWKDGQIVDAAQATVSVLDHGLLYGDGVFEGLRYYHGRPFRLHRHLQRLADSLKALQMSIDYDAEALSNAVIDTIQASGQTQGYLRILVTRGDGSLGLDPSSCGSCHVFVIAAPLAIVSDEARRRGIRLRTVSQRRMIGSGIDSRIKSLNYLHSVMARLEAKSAGADEALMLNQFGRVAECSAENIFIIRDQVLFTPPISEGALQGITRATVMELAKSSGYEVREQSMLPYDLHTADACFLSGSGARLIPVAEVDGYPFKICPGQLFDDIQQAFEALIQQECGY